MRPVRTALCIGAGREQAPVIRLAREMGLRVAAVDGNPHAEGLAIADEARVIDLKDQAAVTAWARTLEAALVLPVPIGAMLLTVGAVNDALGLRGIGAAAARRCVDKLLFHQTMTAAGVRVPPQESAETADEILAAASRLGWPVVVKPRAGSGSRGLFVARDERELRELLPTHFAARRGLLEAASALVQRYVDGHEVGIDAVMHGERFNPLLLRDKNLTELPFRAGFGYLTPAALSAAEAEAVWRVVGAAAGAVGLRDCLLHADVIVDADGAAHVIEMSGRPSGYHLCLRMVPAVVGVDAVQLTIRLALGEHVAFTPASPRGGVLRMLPAPVGRVRAVHGLEEALGRPGVVDGACFLRPGEVVARRTDGPSSYLGYLLTVAATRDQAEAIWRAAADCIEFQVEPAEEAVV